MPIQVDCACGASFKVKDEMAGRKGKCPKCGGQIAVPAPAKELELELEPTTDVGLARPASPPCPSCGIVYPPQIVVCTRCGIELATGQFIAGAAVPATGRSSGPSSSRGAIRTRMNQVEEEKSLIKIVLQTFYNPVRAFDNVGYYLMSSPTNVALTIALFFVGLGGSAFLRAYKELHPTGETTQVEASPEETAEPDAEEAQPPPQKRPRGVHGSVFFGDDQYRMGDEGVGFSGSEAGDLHAECWIRVMDPLAGNERIEASVRFPSGETVSMGKAEAYRGQQTYDFDTQGVEAIKDGTVGSVPFEFQIVRIRAGEAGDETVHTATYKGALTFEKSWEELQAEKEEAMEAAGISPTTEKAAVAATIGVLFAMYAGALLVFLTVMAFVIDVVGRFATGASRFMAMGVSLLLVQGVAGLLSILMFVAGEVGLPWDVVFVGSFFINVLYKYVLLGLAVAGVYETPWFGVSVACFFMMISMMPVPCF